MVMADWDTRFGTPEEAIRLAGDCETYVTVSKAELSQFDGGQPDRYQINLRCREDGQSILMLGDDTGITYSTPADQVAATLRHLVMVHDLPLNRPAPVPMPGVLGLPPEG